MRISSKSLETLLKQCTRLLKQKDNEAYTCIQFASAKTRPIQTILGALNAETASIKSSSQKVEICASRMEFWKLALSFGEEYGNNSMLATNDQRSFMDNPVVASLWHCLHDKPIAKLRLSTFLRAREKDIIDPNYFTIKDIEEYAERTYSSLGYISLEYLGLSSTELDHLFSHLGKTQGIVSFIRGALPLAIKGIEPGLPITLLAEYKISQEQLVQDSNIWASSSMTNIIQEMATTAWQHLDHFDKLFAQTKYPLSINRLFVHSIALRRYLSRLESSQFDLTNPKVHQIDRFLPLTVGMNLFRSMVK